jgi:tripartite-type tricarboxylate transporter receptor subunit TctC
VPFQGQRHETSPPQVSASSRGRCRSAVVSRNARAQAYPTRPIRLVVPFPPGGAFDFVGRPWADKMKPLVGTVVIENIGGGGSSLGAAAVARARPDGYTILLGGTQTHVNEALLKSRPLYDAVKDLDPIAGVAANALCIAVHPAVRAQNLKELRESQSRQAVLWTFRCRLDPASGR